MLPSASDVPVPADTVFGRVVVGVDETGESLVAAVQARVLCAPGGHLALLAVAETYLASHAGVDARLAAGQLEESTRSALARAAELVAPDETEVVAGRLGEALRDRCGRDGTTLLAVGARPHRRLTALTFGGHEVDVLRDAPCSVLVARAGWGPSLPQRIVVVADGSPEARAAEAVARSLAGRLDRELLPVVGIGGDLEVEALGRVPEDAVLDPRRPGEAVAAAAGADALVVVGRGPEDGHPWGGTLVERVVYAARCSVLVVRAKAVR